MQTRHHRKPKSRGGKNDKRNISIVNDRKHEAWHLLFSNHTPHMIAEIINKVWLDPNFEFTVRRRK
jgi:hypothetical protein